jgi:hypothetical protein
MISLVRSLSAALSYGVSRTNVHSAHVLYGYGTFVARTVVQSAALSAQLSVNSNLKVTPYVLCNSVLSVIYVNIIL